MFHLRRLGLPSLPCDACVNPCLNKQVAASDQGSLARQGGEKSQDVSEYDPEHDISKRNMSEVISNITGPCPQVERFMTTVSAAIKKAIADGKLNKKDSEELCFTIKSVSSQVLGNNVFYVNRFTEEMGKRTDEAALNMNISVKNLQLISHKR